jgi:broad specificity phosphatase PhoE
VLTFDEAINFVKAYDPNQPRDAKGRRELGLPKAKAGEWGYQAGDVGVGRRLKKHDGADAKFTHAEVNYQDHPHDGEQCSRCWKFAYATAGEAQLRADGAESASLDLTEPSCLKVQSPISPTGWCERFEQQATPGVEAFSLDKAYRRQLASVNSDLWQARHDLKDMQEERDHPVRSALSAIGATFGLTKRSDAAAVFGMLEKAYDPDEARDNHGKWTASVVTEIQPATATPSILSIHRDPEKGEAARAARDAAHWDDEEGVQYAQVHHVGVQGDGDKLTVVASTHPEDDRKSLVHGAYTDPAEAKQAAEQMSRDAWEQDGKQRDYDDVWREDERAGKDSWDDAVAEWNSANPDRQIGDPYTFGTYPEFESAYDSAHGIGEIMPYPGLRAANEYFEDSYPQNVFRVSTRRVSKNLEKRGAAMTFEKALAIQKAYNPDQARDARGRWTSGAGATGQRQFPPGGAFNKPAKESRRRPVTDPDKRGRFWVYDHDWHLLDTFKSLASAKQLSIAHTEKFNLPSYLYDSTGHREARTVTMQPGVYATRQVGWATGKSGKTAWRDTSSEDALVERFARERAEWEREHGPVGKAMFYGEMRKAIAKAYDPDEPRDDQGEWTSGGDGTKTPQKDGKAPSGRDRKSITQQYLDRHVALQEQAVRDKEKQLQDLRTKLSALHDKSDDIYWGVHGQLGQANSDLWQARRELRDREEERDKPVRSVIGAVLGISKAPSRRGRAVTFNEAMKSCMNLWLDPAEIAKAFDPNEPRDAHGMWSSGAAVHPDKIDYDVGQQWYDSNEEMHNHLTESLDKVYEANSKLWDQSNEAEKHREKGDDIYDEHGEDSKEYKAWDAQDDAQQRKTADHAMAVRNALADHIKFATDVLSDMDDDLGIDAERYGHRTHVGKAYDPDEPRDAHGEWTGGGAVHAAALLHAGTDQKAFGDAFDRLKADKSISRDELARVADHYQNAPSGGTHRYRYANKDEAYRRISGKFLERAQAESKSEIIDRLTGRVGKYLTAGDVHATTALGNETGRKRKAKDFLSTITEVKGGGRIVALPTLQNDGEAEISASIGKSDGKVLPAFVGKKWPMVEIMLMRHGTTKFNNQTDMSQDRVRSWNDVPLTAEGRESAEKAGKKLKKELDGRQAVLITSDLGRAVETGEIVGKAIGVKAINTPLMRPWNLGDFTGKTTAETYDDIYSFVDDTPDEPVPGGESFDDFTARFVEGLRWAIKKAGKKVLVLISHHRNERWLAAWIKAGMPADHSVDAKEYMKTGEHPGGIETFEIDARALAGTGSVGEKRLSLMKRAIDFNEVMRS